MENLSDNRDGLKENLSLTKNATTFLLEAAKWGHFLAVLGFFMVGLLVLIGLFSGTILSLIPQTTALPVGGVVLGIIYTVLAALYFFPSLFLFKFSTKIKGAIKSFSDQELEGALENLKSQYKFIGIMAIITISLYILIFVVSIGATIIGIF
jgi:hypothetical protein